MSITVTELDIYPVKSLAGIRLTRSAVELTGLKLDRRWMVVDPDGVFMTQRRYPQMARIHARLAREGLILGTPGKAAHTVPRATGEQRQNVRVWNDDLEAWRVGPDTDRQLAEAIGERCHLVWFPDNLVRQVDSHFGGEGDRTAFTDGFPVLIISTGSLADLNARLDRPVPMQRFRPNIVASGCDAFDEDRWKQIHIGGVGMRVVKPCSRCVLTTVDPETGIKRGPEPLRTLATFRRRDGKVMFGQNAIPDNEGVISVGDEVIVRA